jgi:cell wall-associated NlpC family hydrolase
VGTPHGRHRSLRALALVCTVAAGSAVALCAPACARKLTAANWDASEQRLVVHEALMSDTSGGGFAGAAPLSAAAESAALGAIAAREGVAPIGFDPAAPLTVVRFDALLVDQLGLGDVAGHVQQVAAAAGLAPPAYFGTEVLARYLGLRYTHPPGEQTLALYPWSLITRAEAAHSLAVVLGFEGTRRPSAPRAGEEAGGEGDGAGGEGAEAGGGAEGGGGGDEVGGGSDEAGGGAGGGGGGAEGESAPTSEPQPAPVPESWVLANARQVWTAFSLPAYTPAQQEALRIAVSKIGMPYVWGGTTDNTADGLEHGGYDCSGFAWRVYKLSGLPWGRQIRGRTAAQQAGEIPQRQRIALREAQPGDLLFFGSARLHSRATESSVIHEAIALSGQWAIHSSDQGVYVLPLTTGWLAQSFSWARRVL